MNKTLMVALAASLLIISCRPIKDPVFQGIENVRIDEVGLVSSKMVLDLAFENPNRFGAKLKGAEGQAWIDTTYLGAFKVDTTIDLPAHSKFTVPVKLDVNMKKILKNSLSMLMRDQVDIRIEGTARASRSGVTRRFNIRYTGKQSIQSLLQ